MLVLKKYFFGRKINFLFLQFTFIIYRKNRSAIFLLVAFKTYVTLKQCRSKNILLRSALQYSVAHIQHSIFLSNFPVAVDICPIVALILWCPDNRKFLFGTTATLEQLPKLGHRCEFDFYPNVLRVLKCAVCSTLTLWLLKIMPFTRCTMSDVENDAFHPAAPHLLGFLSFRIGSVCATISEQLALFHNGWKWHWIWPIHCQYFTINLHTLEMFFTQKRTVSSASTLE